MTLESKVVKEILMLLREWGWETGLEKLKAHSELIADEEQRIAMQLFTAWMAGERGAHQEAVAIMKELERIPALASWAIVGEAFIAMRDRNDALAHQMLDKAIDGADPNDLALRATIAHCRGAVYYHDGKARQALQELHDALEWLGSEHFGSARVLDTLGMIYANQNNWLAAREFFERSIMLKEKLHDDAGIALSHGNLGRLYLDKDDLHKAETHFKINLEISQRIHDKRGVALMYNYLGQVAIQRNQWVDATNWLDESITLSSKGGWTIMEGFAHKDRARASLGDGDFIDAEQQLQVAEDLFRRAGFQEGMAHANYVKGLLWRVSGRYEESESALRSALGYFDTKDEPAEAARILFEIAQTLSRWNKPRRVIVEALLTALNAAERCRLDALVREIETELRALDEARLALHIYQRIRGRDVREDTVSLHAGIREAASIIFLDVVGSTEYARTQDPEEVMMTLNQMMGDFEIMLKQYNASVTAYLGDGFMAMVRGTHHPSRAVDVTLDLIRAMREFNRPRQVLGLRTLDVRIGISTGEVFIGNVGTYHKMDFTAIGSTVNLAARLQGEAEIGYPCISRETHEQLPAGLFLYKRDDPRVATLKGIGERQVWDVLSRK